MNENNVPHFANLTVAFKYVKELPKLARQYNVQLVLPIVVSPDATESNFTIAGSHNDVLRFCQKFANDRLAEGKAYSVAHEEEEKHEGLISREDVLDVKILVNASKDVNEFIARI